MNLTVIQDYILITRIESLIINLDRENYKKFNFIINKTIYNIKNYEVCYVNYFNLQSYLQKIQLAQLLLCCECYDAVRQELYNARKLISTNFGKMKDSYMMLNRLKKYNNNIEYIGNFIILPNDIIRKISDLVLQI